MGSGGSKAPPGQLAVFDKDNSTDLSSSPTTAPKDTNVNSGGEQPTNQKSTAESKPTSQEKPATSAKQIESQGSTQSESKKSEEKDCNISENSTTNQTKGEEVKKAVEPAENQVKEVEIKQTDSTMPVSNI